VVPAHAMDAHSRRRRRRAEEQAGRAGSVGVEAEDRTGDELREVRRSTGDVPADDIRVSSFELGRPDGARGDDAFPKARREPLDLILDPRAHVDRRAVWDVT